MGRRHDQPGGPSGGRTGLQNREKWAGFRPLEGDAGDLIRSIRDRVLEAAQLGPGQHLLDVGAGTGLIALAARPRVAPGGGVVALDISERALAACRGDAVGLAGSPSASTATATATSASVAWRDGTGASLLPVAGDAGRLPFAAGRFDAVTARSVLMYVDDKPAAAREIYRVLRPGGRASVYEPINRHTVPARWFEALEGAALPPAHEAIVAELQERIAQENPDRAPSIAFDERDLIDAFIAAGFSDVRLTYEYRYTEAQRVEPKPVRWYLERSPYGEVARGLLGDAAEVLLAQLESMVVTLPQRGRSAAAYLVAHR